MKAKLPPRPAMLPDQAYENVCHCRHTKATRKRAYLHALAACGDIAAASLEHDRQRLGELRKGPAPAKLFPDEGLGVLMSESVFVDKTAPLFAMSPLKFKRQLNAWLRFHEKRLHRVAPTEGERLAADS